MHHWPDKKHQEYILPNQVLSEKNENKDTPPPTKPK
jgi:hypothetical protein